MIVYTGGVFDLFHIGHLEHLKAAKKFGDILVVGLLDDEAAENYKRRPIIPYEQRKAILESVADVVIRRTERSEVKIFQDLNPDIITKGGHTLCDESLKWIKDNNKRLVFLPYTQEQSTSKIINKIYEKVKSKQIELGKEI